MNWILQYQFFVLLGIIAAAAAILGWLTANRNRRLKRILDTAPGKEPDITANILRRLERLEGWVRNAAPRLEALEEISKITVQKVGFLRFNPFRDTGGDQSFVLVMLDRENNGILLSSLYTREGMRIYGKAISGGKTKYPLSEEEKKVLEETITKGIRN